MKTRILLAALAAVIFLVTAAAAQEKKITRKDLPAAVQKTVDEQTKGATIRGYAREVDKGKTEYEVESTVNGRVRDVSIAPDGTVLVIEEEVVLDQLPPAVRDGLRGQAGKATIGKVESLTKAGRLVAYEAKLAGGKKKEIQVGPDGKPLAHEE